MPPARELDPSSSVLAYFGSELRRYRSAAGITQERLGEIISYTGALVGLVETARRSPTQDFAERCDAALNTDGALSRLWPLVNRGAFPSWFRGYVELEAAAISIRKFEVQAVPGLLQTEAYARAIITAGRPRDSEEQIEERVAARLGRQALLKSVSPPLVWAVLDEAIIRRPVGGAAVMREQLAYLIKLANTPHVVLQVLPFDAGEHAAMDGSLTVISFNEGADVVYVEGPRTGHLVERPEDVRECVMAYDLARAEALPPAASVAMIRSTMEGLGT
ncbi:helix-turn-helix domain-containing protein [Kitasatospora sp. NPDC001175]|uniref:helix-turn-helix domain-containing protein n=1 Tax=Kitasatospora sp. NPDC001175 TaxID=3157103 RepID=UPI003CFBC3E2